MKRARDTDARITCIHMCIATVLYIVAEPLPVSNVVGLKRRQTQFKLVSIRFNTKNVFVCVHICIQTSVVTKSQRNATKICISIKLVKNDVFCDIFIKMDYRTQMQQKGKVIASVIKAWNLPKPPNTSRYTMQFFILLLFRLSILLRLIFKIRRLYGWHLFFFKSSSRIKITQNSHSIRMFALRKVHENTWRFVIIYRKWFKTKS